MYRFLYWLVLRRLPAEATHRVSFALLRVLIAVPGIPCSASSSGDSTLPIPSGSPPVSTKTGRCPKSGRGSVSPSPSSAR